jgi:hypothetical protein
MRLTVSALALAFVAGSGMGCAVLSPGDPDEDTSDFVDLDEAHDEEDLAEHTEKVPQWEAKSAGDERSSTHLWIVNRAVAILGRHPELPRAAAAHRLMTDPTCAPRWRQGLFDADYKKEYIGGRWDISPTSSEATIIASGANWVSHFYDPDTGKNWKNQTSPTAKTQALLFLGRAQANLAAGRIADGCYELGLMLHYFTDIAQPMHTALYKATDWPIRLHTHLEGAILDQQWDYVLTDWDGAPAQTTAAAYIDRAARLSKSQWGDLWEALRGAYSRRCKPLERYYFDHTECYEGDPQVNDVTGESLYSAQRGTAELLYVVGVTAP